MRERGCNMGAIIWVIIVIWVVVAVSKGKSPNSSQSARPVNTMQQKARSNEKNNSGWQQAAQPVKQTATQQTMADYGSDPAAKQRELKERLAKKYNKSSGSVILERAKASVAEDFDKAQEGSKAVNSYNTGGETTQNQGLYKSTGISGRPVEKQTAGDRIQTESSPMIPVDGTSDTMKEIENLMITGPDTSIAFERDFISEGLDMLNQIQV